MDGVFADRDARNGALNEFNMLRLSQCRRSRLGLDCLHVGPNDVVLGPPVRLRGYSVYDRGGVGWKDPAKVGSLAREMLEAGLGPAHAGRPAADLAAGDFPECVRAVDGLPEYLDRFVETPEMFSGADFLLRELLRPHLNQRRVRQVEEAVFGGGGRGRKRGRPSNEEPYHHRSHRLCLVHPDITHGAEPVPLPVLAIHPEDARGLKDYGEGSRYPLMAVWGDLAEGAPELDRRAIEARGLPEATVKEIEASKGRLSRLMLAQLGKFPVNRVGRMLRAPCFVYSTRLHPVRAADQERLHMPGSRGFHGRYTDKHPAERHRELLARAPEGGGPPFRVPDVGRGEKMPVYQWTVRGKDGVDVADVERVVQECGPGCGLSGLAGGVDGCCAMHPSRWGLRWRLYVSTDPTSGLKEWGLYTLERIPKNSVVMPYLGAVTDIVRTPGAGGEDDDGKGGAGDRKTREYTSEFEMRGPREVMGSVEPSYSVDAYGVRNAAALCNSDEPGRTNLTVLMVTWGHSSWKHGIPLLIASRDIRPLEELTLSYGSMHQNISRAQQQYRELKRPKKQRT